MERFPNGTLVRLKAKAVPRKYLPVNAIYTVYGIGEDSGTVFVARGACGFYVHPDNIREIIPSAEVVIFT
jgi:hypothetical protein